MGTVAGLKLAMCTRSDVQESQRASKLDAEGVVVDPGVVRAVDCGSV